MESVDRWTDEEMDGLTEAQTDTQANVDDHNTPPAWWVNG